MEKDQPPPYSPYNPNVPGSAPPPAGFKMPEQPPLQPMGPPHPQPQSTTTTHHVVVTTMQQFGPTPADMMCPYCHAHISTSIKTEPNTKTHLFALLLCLFQCYCCCCIPYCVDSCQSQNHYCPNCQAYLGAYQN